jgi:SAM-dependent methyltransferase
MTLRTNYEGHDALYRRRRSEGATGWDSEEGTEENIVSIERLLTESRIEQVGSMLELGCGAGNLTTYFAKRGWDAHGVDISACAIDWARERAEQMNLDVDYQIGNVLNLENHASASLDLVLDGHCFHCIIGPDRQVFLREARRVLRPKGKLLIMTMCGGFPREFAGSGVLDEATRCQLIDGVATRYFGDADSIVQEIDDAGFEVQQVVVEPRKSEGETDHLLVSAAWA